MNNPEKINALLAKEGRTIVYGKPETSTAENIISISIGESTPTVHSLGEKGRVTYTMVIISVYCSDYILGYNLLQEIKSEIEAAVKSTVKIAFIRFAESTYDATLKKHVLKSEYKIIE